METKPNKGDKVVITKLDNSDPSCIKVGMTGIIIDDCDVAPCVDLDIEPNDPLHTGGGIASTNTVWALSLDQFELVKS